MIKIVYAWRDHAEIGADGCEQHYLENHTGLARRAFDGTPGFRALVYNRVREARVNDHNSRESREVEPDIDAFIELYFEDRESLARAFESPALTAMFKDHENFMETDVEANVRIYEVEENVILGALDLRATE